MKQILKPLAKKCGLCLILFVSMGLCITQFEEGQWSNTDSNTSGITKTKVRFICQDQILNGVPCCPPGPNYYIHLYGKCSPSDCDWGEVPARRLESGFIYATYDQGFARRYVYLKESQYRPNTMWMYIYTDFKDTNRKDYSIQQWFKK